MAVQDVLSPEELKRYYDSADNLNLSPGWVGREHDSAPDIEPFLWRWSEVTRWLAISLGTESENRDDHVMAAINAGLELRHHGRYVHPDWRPDLRELVDL